MVRRVEWTLRGSLGLSEFVDFWPERSKEKKTRLGSVREAVREAIG